MHECSRLPVAHGRSAPRGFTLVELMVAMTITLFIAGGAMALALSGRRAYEVDATRIGVNRSLRAAGDFLVVDLRQAGERLGDDFPAFEIIDGVGGAPDELVVRRNLLQVVLRVCSDTVDLIDEIQVAWKASHPLAPPPAGCAPLPDADFNGWPDNIQAWKEYREAAGGEVVAYIYNPVSGLGETFNYQLELDDPTAYVIVRDTGSAWTNDYLMAEQSRLYILEQRRYRLVDGVLELVVDDDTVNPLRLVDRIVDFQVQADVGGTLHDSFLVSDAWYDWVDVDGVHVRLEGRSPFRLRHINRRWSTRVLPRNVLSR